MKLMTCHSHRKITEMEKHIQTCMILLCHFYGLKWNLQAYQSITNISKSFMTDYNDENEFIPDGVVYLKCLVR